MGENLNLGTNQQDPVIQLSQVADNLRDQNWENQFLKALTESNLTLISDNPVPGPDGWPYLMTEINPDSTESAQKILGWLSTRGMGLVVNPRKDYPDYIFSYGMIWSFRETGLFFQNSSDGHSGIEKNFSIGDLAHAGTPTEKYLPLYVRQILREFFRDQGVLGPKVLLLSKDRIQYDLAFSVESLKNPPESELEGIAEAIGWFLPPHYSILLVSEKDLPPFVDL
jgi:hypothetical protein